MRKFHNPIGVAAYALLFGVLMAARYQASNGYARVLIAGVAGAVLGLLLGAARGPAPIRPK
jgi:hypothetical protein